MYPEGVMFRNLSLPYFELCVVAIRGVRVDLRGYAWNRYIKRFTALHKGWRDYRCFCVLIEGSFFCKGFNPRSYDIAFVLFSKVELKDVDKGAEIQATAVREWSVMEKIHDDFDACFRSLADRPTQHSFSTCTALCRGKRVRWRAWSSPSDAPGERRNHHFVYLSVPAERVYPRYLYEYRLKNARWFRRRRTVKFDIESNCPLASKSSRIKITIMTREFTVSVGT